MFRAISAALREPRHLAEIERIEAAALAAGPSMAHFDASRMP
jgi:hypothetical protein